MIYRDSAKLEEKLRQEPDNPDRQYELALAYLDLQRNSEALELLDRCLESRRRDSSAFYARAVANLSMSNFRKAGCDLLRTIALDPVRLEAYKHLGFVQLTLGKEEAALKTLQRALEIDPAYADAWCILGDAYMDLSEHDKAREAFLKALEIDPDGAEPHCKMAMYYVARGDMKGLKQEYELLKTLDRDMARQIGTLFFYDDHETIS
ncbi:MAG: tetratricopeptide repeat protein [Chlorobiaceae bacterium]